jgi:succinate dehydrogenase / fumarate reductase membrane anchor subunit
MHAWVGVRDVLIDYVWNTSQRVIALSVVATILVACALWATQALVLARLI